MDWKQPCEIAIAERLKLYPPDSRSWQSSDEKAKEYILDSLKCSQGRESALYLYTPTRKRALISGSAARRKRMSFGGIVRAGAP